MASDSGLISVLVLLDLSALSAPNADFAFALYKRLNARTAAGNNIFFSPLGISTALSVLSTGAHSETHSQLFSSLGYSTLNQTQVNEAYQHLFHVLGQSQENQKLDVVSFLTLPLPPCFSFPSSFFLPFSPQSCLSRL
uniref:Serpin domain-containing protein n=1 Tax=Maylandia zebra TaxID=106582 RepID=A0A3P9BDW0_9CICH